MNKQERYINYIVDDLISKTEIDYDMEIFHFKFLNKTMGFGLLTHQPYSHHSFPYSIMEYMRERYGSREGELMMIQKLYRSKLQSLIKK